VVERKCRDGKGFVHGKRSRNGGRSGHGRTADGQLDVDLRLPTEMGGEGGGTNPEELFAVGWAACFESALAGVARRRHLDVGEVTIESAVSLLPTGEGGFKLAATLNVSIPTVSERGAAVELIRGATKSARTPTPPEETSTWNFFSTVRRSKTYDR